MTQVPAGSPRPSSASDPAHRGKSEIWRWIPFSLVLLFTLFGAFLWPSLISLPHHEGPTAFAIVLVFIPLAIYAYGRSRAAAATRRLENQLLQQNEFRRSLLESFPDLILVFDLEERHTFVNSRVRDVLGLAPADLLGKKISDDGIHSPELIALYREVVAGKQFASAEYGAHVSHGSVTAMRSTASQFFDGEGKLAGAILSVRDISTEKRFEQQAIQGERLAAMGAMIGGVAHELNNPLTSILGFSDLLQETQATDEARKYVALLQQQARRAAEIVRNLTYFATPPTPGKVRVNLADVLERTLNLHAYSLRKNGIAVDFVKPPNLPFVMGDPHQLMQVFLNLILNAEQSIREVGTKGTLSLRLECSAESVAIRFSDNGPGIRPETLGRIFDPFFTTRRPGRTGLGLSICRSVIKEHNGTIEAANAQEGGTVFTVTLPAVKPSAG